MINTNIEFVDPDYLRFDYQNPRVAEFNVNKATSEAEVLKILWTVMGVEEIVLSIKASGFFQHEPLLVVVEDGENIVIEGNRRLAAIKGILRPNIIDFPGINKNIFGIDADIIKSLKRIPVIRLATRQEAWKFIGFKHINGAAKWGSYAKAQYISQIHHEFGIPLAEIANQIGDTNKTVEKLFQGLKVIEQAEKVQVFNRTDIYARRLYFSHLYTGLTYDGFKDFLNIKDVPESTVDPVPAERTKNLGELLVWLYGNIKEKKSPVIISQNPDLRHLDAVLKSEDALFELRGGSSLNTAYELSRPKDETFEQSLREARRALQKAAAYQIEGFDGKDEALMRLASAVAGAADELYEQMEHKWKSLNEPTVKKRRFSE